MSISKKIYFGLLIVSGCLFSAAGYLSGGMVSLLIVAGFFVFMVSCAILINSVKI